MNLSELAGEAYAQFERATRDGSDETFTRLKQDAPEWLSDLVREAHCGMFPDDWRYESIRSAIGAIDDSGAEDRRDCDDLDFEFSDSNVDTYNADRTEWLSSHLERAGYCDDAVPEGLIAEDADILDRIGIGQFMESLEIFASVLDSLCDRLAFFAESDA